MWDLTPGSCQCLTPAHSGRHRQYEREKHNIGIRGNNQNENIRTTPLNNREYKIPTYEIRGLATANMYDRAYISEEDVEMLTSVEYMHFNHHNEYGFDNEDGIDMIEENLQQDDFIPMMILIWSMTVMKLMLK